MVPILLLKQKWWDEEVFVFFKISVWVIYVLVAFWHFLSNKQSVSPSTVFVIVKQCCKVCACVSEHVCAVSHACLTCQCLWAQLQSTVIISVVNCHLCVLKAALHTSTQPREKSRRQQEAVRSSCLAHDCWLCNSEHLFTQHMTRARSRQTGEKNRDTILSENKNISVL